jgi:hypothetical protein
MLAAGSLHVQLAGHGGTAAAWLPPLPAAAAAPALLVAVPAPAAPEVGAAAAPAAAIGTACAPAADIAIAAAPAFAVALMAAVFGVVVGAGAPARAGVALVDIEPAAVAVVAGLVIVATVAGALAPPGTAGTAFAIPGSEAQPANANTMRQPAPTKQLVLSMTSSTRFPSKHARTPPHPDARSRTLRAVRPHKYGCWRPTISLKLQLTNGTSPTLQFALHSNRTTPVRRC